MKQMEEFTDMSLLKAIAGDKEISVPERLEDDIRATLNMMSFLNEEEPAKKVSIFSRVAGIAASVILLAGIGLGINHFASAPKDTFTDPYLAYAQLEETFALISSKMDKGLSMAQEAGTVIVRTNEIMEKIN